MRRWLTAILLLGALLPLPAQAKGKRAPTENSKTLRLPAPSFQEPTWDDWLLDLRTFTAGASTGRANLGAVYGSMEMPLRGPSWRFMSVVEQRKTNYGNPALITLLMHASAAVAEEFPGSVLLVGNMGLENGGKIAQSKSHQSGRDVDIAFFVLDRKGRPVDTGTFVRIKSSGKSSDGLSLDLPRTWAFVRAMVSSSTPAVQWLFASKGVSELLLQYARSIGEPEEIQERARQVLHQPSDSNPHDDHFHVRIHCSDYDLLVGCEEYGAQRPWLVRNMDLVDEEAHRLYQRARLGIAHDRAVATRRLTLVQSPKVNDNLESLLCSTDDDVVEAAAAGLLTRLPAKAEEALARHLKCAKSSKSALLLLKPSQYRLADGIAREAAAMMNDYCTPSKYQPAHAELCDMAAGILGRSRDFRHADALLNYLEALPPDQCGSALSGLSALYLAQRPEELLSSPSDPNKKGKKPSATASDTKLKKKKGKKGRAQPDSDGSAHTQLETWKTVVRKVGEQNWNSYARERLRILGILKDGPADTKVNIRRLGDAVRQKGPVSFAAQVLLASLLDVPMPYFMTGERASSFWGPKMPKLPPKQPKTSKSSKPAPQTPKHAPPPADFEP